MLIQKMKTLVVTRNPGYKDDCELYRVLGTASEDAFGD